MNWRTYLDVDDDALGGSPFVKGTNLSAEFLLNELARGTTIRRLLEAYPEVSPEALRAVFELAAESVHRKYPPKVSDDFFEGPEWTVIER